MTIFTGVEMGGEEKKTGEKTGKKENLSSVDLTGSSRVVQPNLFRGQRAMMHIPGSSRGEAFHPPTTHPPAPVFVIVRSCGAEPASRLSHSWVKRCRIPS